MRAVLVFRSDKEAHVQLIPSFLSRLFGARIRDVLLINIIGKWITAGTHRMLDNVSYGPLIQDALDSLPPTIDIPTATVIRR